MIVFHHSYFVYNNQLPLYNNLKFHFLYLLFPVTFEEISAYHLTTLYPQLQNVLQRAFASYIHTLRQILFLSLK